MKNELLLFSVTVRNIPLEETTIQKIFFLDDEDFLQDEFLDENPQDAVKIFKDRLLRYELSIVYKA